MEQAITYVEQVNKLVGALVSVPSHKNVQVVKGRKYDRVLVDGTVKFFIAKDTTVIYGAKSAVQHNLRRQYGTTAQIDQMNWGTLEPNQNTALAADVAAREATIKAGYKKRGRPRKVTP